MANIKLKKPTEFTFIHEFADGKVFKGSLEDYPCSLVLPLNEANKPFYDAMIGIYKGRIKNFKYA